MPKVESFQALAELVEGSFAPRRHTCISVDRTATKRGVLRVKWSVYVERTVHDESESVAADTCEEVAALFRERWLRDVPESNPAAESARVDA